MKTLGSCACLKLLPMVRCNDALSKSSWEGENCCRTCEFRCITPQAVGTKDVSSAPFLMLEYFTVG